MKNATPEQLAKAPGIGIKKAREFVNNLKESRIKDATLFQFDSSKNNQEKK